MTSPLVQVQATHLCECIMALIAVDHTRGQSVKMHESMLSDYGELLFGMILSHNFVICLFFLFVCFAYIVRLYMYTCILLPIFMIICHDFQHHDITST